MYRAKLTIASVLSFQLFVIFFQMAPTGCGKHSQAPHTDMCAPFRPLFNAGTATCTINDNGKQKTVATCTKLLEDGDAVDRCNAFCVRQDGMWEKLLEIKNNPQKIRSFTAQVLLNPNGNAIAGLLECSVAP